MSHWKTYVEEREAYFVQNCPLYEGGVVSHLLFRFRDFPTLISIVLFTAQFYGPLRDIYYPVAISAGMTANLVLNWAIRTQIRAHGASPTCGSQEEMPPFAIQQGALMMTFLITFGGLWRSHISNYTQQFMYFLLGATILARSYLGYNTRLQIEAGVLIGGAVALAWQIAVYNLFCLSARYAHRIFSTWIIARLHYANRWCRETWTPVQRATPGEFDAFEKAIKILDPDTHKQRDAAMRC